MSDIKRVYCRKGDLFEVRKNNSYRYFQLVTYDMTDLNSDVIAVFKGKYSKPQDPSNITTQAVDFFTHITAVRFGVPEFWRKVGTAQPVDFSSAIFKLVDYVKDGRRQPSAGKSNHWVVWTIDNDWEYVGKGEKVPLNAELGLVFDPGSIYKKITEGKYGGVYHGVQL